MYIHDLSYTDKSDSTIHNYIYCLDSTLNSSLDDEGCLHFNNEYDTRISPTADLSFDVLKSAESVKHLTFEVDGHVCATKSFWSWRPTLSSSADITMYQVQDDTKSTLFEGRYECSSEGLFPSIVKGKYYWEGQSPGYDADLLIDSSWIKFYQDLGELAAPHFSVDKDITITQKA